MPVFGAILVRIFPAFSRFRTEYGHIQSECEKMREKCGSEFLSFFFGEFCHWLTFNDDLLTRLICCRTCCLSLLNSIFVELNNIYFGFVLKSFLRSSKVTNHLRFAIVFTLSAGHYSTFLQFSVMILSKILLRSSLDIS